MGCCMGSALRVQNERGKPNNGDEKQGHGKVGQGPQLGPPDLRLEEGYLLLFSGRRF